MALPEDDDDRLPPPVDLGTTPIPDDQPTAPLSRRTATIVLPPSFVPEQIVAGRFRIVRFIAQGGMGEVYEAFDQELDERVALKTVKPAIAGDVQALERFHREVQLSRRVTHRNVCRIFDVFRHRAEGGTGRADVVFLTMELLSGRTLSEQVRTYGPLPVAEALPLAEQMVAAIEAAHRAEIVHRDFKSNNVVLEPLRAGGSRVVVTDFGLASAAGATEAGGPAFGTPAYMAPEQVERGVVGPAADIYALGVVLFELVTGALPFKGPTAAATATLRLREAPPSPRVHRPDLDPRWEAAILRCLERDPSRRFASARAVLDALRPPPPRRFALPLVALVALGLGALVFWQARRPLLVAQPLKSVQITNSTGLDLFPALSPDGQRLAFSSDRSGRFEIYVRGVAQGSREVAVTKDGGENLQPAWSPDGRQIAFHSRAKGGVWLVPVEGGTPTRLTSFGSQPTYSHDGELIVFQSEELVDLAANAVAAMPPSILWRVPATGGAPVAITSSGQPAGGHGAPACSPDGKRVLFTTSDRRDTAVWSASIRGDDVVRLSPVGTQAYDPVYAPDGRRVYFAGLNATGGYGLWAVALDSLGHAEGAAVELADFGLGTSRQLSLSADGKRLAFSALRINSNLVALPLRGVSPAGPPVPLTRETGRNARPVFAPDGARVAFEKWQSGSNPDLWVANVDGSEAWQATSSPAVDSLPNWDREGDRIVFRSDRGGHAAIWALNLADRRETRLADMRGDADWPRLSPDGRSLALQMRPQGGSMNVWRLELPNGEPRQLTHDAEFAGFPAWSPDGRFLAVQVKRDEGYQAGVISAEGGEPTLLTKGRGQSWPYSWSPDGDHIAFAGYRDGYWNVYAISRSTLEELRLTNYEKLNAYVRYPAWSPKGDRMVFEYAETVGNVFLIQGLK